MFVILKDLFFLSKSSVSLTVEQSQFELLRMNDSLERNRAQERVNLMHAPAIWEINNFRSTFRLMILHFRLLGY